MSRIGNKPITLSDKITVTFEGDLLKVQGSEGNLMLKILEGVKVNLNDKVIEVGLENPKGKSDIQGLFRSILQNAITGVEKKWTKTLELSGVGYSASTTGSKLILNLGFSHPVNIEAPTGITFGVKENKITVTGVDKYSVGEEAAKIKKIRPPEPYKGKGIKYEGEHIRKKLGKAAKAVGGVGAK